MKHTTLPPIDATHYVTTQKYRFYPNVTQTTLLTNTFGCTRFVYNEVLDIVIAECNAHFANKALDIPDWSYAALCRKLTRIKQDYPWLYDVSSVTLQQSMKRLSKACAKKLYVYVDKTTGARTLCRRGNTYPAYKSYTSAQSATFTNLAFTFDEKTHVLKIAKCDYPLKIRWSRKLPSTPSSITITRNSSHQYHVSFTVEKPVIKPTTLPDKIIGGDAGVKTLLVTSDGQIFPNAKHAAKLKAKLAYLQRCAHRKQKGSKNRAKANKRTAKCYQRIVNQRTDTINKIAATLVPQCRAIALEHLNTQGMMRNHKLAYSLADASMSKIRSAIIRKAQISGHCATILVNKLYPSTQLCSHCGTRSEEKIKLGVSTWTCDTCGTTHDRDINAAVNLRNVAIAERATWEKTLTGITMANEPYVVA